MKSSSKRQWLPNAKGLMKKKYGSQCKNLSMDGRVLSTPGIGQSQTEMQQLVMYAENGTS